MRAICYWPCGTFHGLGGTLYEYVVKMCALKGQRSSSEQNTYVPAVVKQVNSPWKWKKLYV